MKRFTAICLGLFTTILIIEGALWIYYFLKSPTLPIHNVVKSDEFTIATFGNSHTYGVGASSRDHYSYPAQLEKILSTRDPDKRFRVINLSSPNFTSASVLRVLSDFLAHNEPDFVTLRMGEPNQWNSDGYLNYLSRNANEQSLQARVFDYLHWSRAFKLFSHLSFSSSTIQEPTNSLIWEARTFISRFQTYGYRNSPLVDFRFPSVSLAQLENYLKHYPNDHRAWDVVALLYYHLGDYEQGLESHINALNHYEGFHFFVYHELDRIQFKASQLSPAIQSLYKTALNLASKDYPGDKKYNELRNFFLHPHESSNNLESFYQYFLGLDPGNPVYATPYIRQLLIPEGRFQEALLTSFQAALHNPSYIPEAQRTYEAALQFLDRELLHRNLKEFKEQFFAVYKTENIFYPGQDTYIKWALSDIEQAIQLLTALEIPYVLLNYPPPIRYNSRRLDNAIRDFSKTHHYNFLDTEKNILQTFPTREERIKLYSQQSILDDHLNDDGYEILAQEIADYLWAKKLTD